MCRRIFPCLARPTSQDSCAAARAPRAHPPVSAKTNQSREAAAAAAGVPREALEAEEALVPLPVRRPALRWGVRHLLEAAVPELLALPQAARVEAVVCAAAQRCRDCR